MGKNRLCAIQTILAFCIVLVSLLAGGCFHSQPSTPPAQITGRVIISQKVESSASMPTLPNDYIFWIVNLTIKNVAYASPIEIDSKAFSLNYTGYSSSPWTSQTYTYYICAFSKPGSLPVGQSGEFTILLAVPPIFSVATIQVVYQGSNPPSFGTLTLEEKAAAYDWDTQTVTAKMPSHDNLVVAILVCFLLAAVRWYPDVRRIIRRDRVVKSETRIMKTSLDRTLNHPILGILVIIIVGLVIYYLYPSIGYKALIPAIVIVVIYIVGRWILSRALEARIRKAIRLQEEQRRMAQEQLRIEQEKKNSEEEKEARKLLEESENAIELDPEDAEAWQDKGSALMDLGRPEEALEALEKAIKLDPENMTSWVRKSSVLLTLGRNNESLEASEEVIKLNPNDVIGWYEKCMALYAVGRYKEALETNQKAIGLDAGAMGSWMWNGKILYSLGRHKEALEAYEKAIKLDPKNASAWLGKGLNLFELRRIEQALEAFEKATILDPNYATAWDRKGLVLYCLDRFKEALQANEKAIKLEPDNPALWRAKGSILNALGRYEEEEAANEMADRLKQSISTEYSEVSAINIPEFENYYWQLPVYGCGEEGIKTSEFAMIIRKDSQEARKILESWRALGRATRRPSGREYKWWRKEI